MVSCTLAHPLFQHFATLVGRFKQEFVNKSRAAGREHLQTGPVHHEPEPNYAESWHLAAPKFPALPRRRRPHRSVNQWRRPPRVMLLQRELASCIVFSFSSLPRAVLAMSFLARSNKKTSWAGACLPACKRGCALLAEDFANNALDCSSVRSYILQLDSRRELQADIMGVGDACSRV